MKKCKKFLDLDVEIIRKFIGIQIKPTQIVSFGSLLATLATLLQSAGAMGGAGFLLSAISTLPILISTVLSIRMGFLSYLVALFMIFIIQPSELFTYPFTTGLLGLSIGLFFRLFKRGYLIAIFSGISLTMGILFLLYVIQFPILGPSFASTLNIKIPVFLTLFSIGYSWIWIKILTFLTKRLHSLRL